MKAFHCTMSDEDHQILFGDRDIEVRSQYASEFGWDGVALSGVSCVRASWADKYAAKGWVPPRACIEEGGWTWGCSTCSTYIGDNGDVAQAISVDWDTDTERYVEAADGDHLCCSRECFDLDTDKRAKKKEREALFLNLFIRGMKRKNPGLVVLDGTTCTVGGFRSWYGNSGGLNTSRVNLIFQYKSHRGRVDFTQTYGDVVYTVIPDVIDEEEDTGMLAKQRYTKTTTCSIELEKADVAGTLARGSRMTRQMISGLEYSNTRRPYYLVWPDLDALIVEHGKMIVERDKVIAERGGDIRPVTWGGIDTYGIVRKDKGVIYVDGA